MLTVVVGNDSVGILNFIQSKKKSFAGQEVIEVDSKNYTRIQIEDLSNSVGMFSFKKLIIINADSISDVDFNEKFLSNISENRDVEILINASKLTKTTNVYKLLVKYGNKFVFDKKRNYEAYNISDAFFSGKKDHAVSLLIDFYKNDDDFYSVLNAIHLGLRNLTGKLEKNASWTNLHPYVQKKIIGINIGPDKLKVMYKKLFEIDAKSKSIPEKRLNLLLDFMLESDL